MHEMWAPPRAEPSIQPARFSAKILCNLPKAVDGLPGAKARVTGVVARAGVASASAFLVLRGRRAKSAAERGFRVGRNQAAKEVRGITKLCNQGLYRGYIRIWKRTWKLLRIVS